MGAGVTELAAVGCFFCTKSLRANSGRGYGAFAKKTTDRRTSGLEEQLIQTEFESFVVSGEAGFVYWEETEINVCFFPKIKKRKRLAFYNHCEPVQ